jgi:hypothetical protein
MKVLVLTSEPIDADAVRAALGDEAEGAEVLVVSPALNDSPVAFWVSDSDEAIGKASEVAQETVERLEEGGLDAAGDTGESEPLRALEDAMTTFPADRVVVFAHPKEQRAYREEEIAEAEQRLGVPVIRGEISR